VYSSNAAKLQEWEMMGEFDPTGSGRSAYITSISWSKWRGDEAYVAVGWWYNDEDGSKVGSVSVWSLSDGRSATPVLLLKLDPSLRAEVRDVDWAPAMGRPHHLIAAAVGNSVQVWRVVSLGRAGESPARAEVVNMHEEQGDRQTWGSMTVWRVGWNLTGTTLAASSENGQVKMWKLDFQGILQHHLSLDPAP